MAVKAIVLNNVKSSWVIGKVVFDKKINTDRVYFKRKKLPPRSCRFLFSMMVYSKALAVSKKK